MSKRALVTGASGFLGSAVCRRLVADGWEVTGMRRETSDISGLADLPMEWVTADVLDRGAVIEAIEGHEYVFHLVGIGLMDGDEETVFRVNVDGTRNVLEGCRRAGVERMAFTSTAGTRYHPDRPATEDDLVEPIGAYQQSKLVAEELVDEYAATHGEAVTVQPTSVFGPGDERFTGRLIFLAVHPIPVYLPGGVSIVSVNDVADGIVAAMERGRSGEHYLLDGQNLTFGEAIEIIAQLCGGSKPPIRIPAGLVRLAGPVMGVVNRIAGTRMFPINTGMARLSTRELFYDSTKARRELGYDPAPLWEHAGSAIAWYVDGETNPDPDPASALERTPSANPPR